MINFTTRINIIERIMNNLYKLDDNFSEALLVRIARGLETSSNHLSKLIDAGVFGRIHILRNHSLQPIGYVAYATITKSTLKMLGRTHGVLYYSHEWNEGNIVHIVDIVLDRNYETTAIAKLREFLNGKRLISFIKRSRLMVYGRKYKRYDGFWRYQPIKHLTKKFDNAEGNQL